MFLVEIDPKHAIVSVIREGFFTLEEMQQSVDAVRSAINSFQGKQFRLLADFRKFKPASPEVATKLSEILTFTYRSGAERVAHVISSSVMLLQIRRLAKETGVAEVARQFDNTEDARQWLITGTEPRDIPKT
jgi:hypothetical protein